MNAAREMRGATLSGAVAGTLIAPNNLVATGTPTDITRAAPKAYAPERPVNSNLEPPYFGASPAGASPGWVVSCLRGWPE
jgi:hypothetical protein